MHCFLLFTLGLVREKTPYFDILSGMGGGVGGGGGVKSGSSWQIQWSPIKD